MNHEPKIAVVHPDTLAAIGLRQLLQAVMPTLGVDAYRSAGEVPAGQADAYVHYFAAVAAVAAAPQFFAARRRQTIVLSPVPGAPLAGYHSICTSAPERSLVKALLALEQSAHGGGRNMPPPPAGGAAPSPREAEVMTLVVKGLINKEIAARLNISQATVVTHRHNLMEKLGLRSVSALAIYAVTHGYVDISEI